MFFKNKIVTLITVATLIRFIIALSIDLGNDEVYYITYAKQLQWNYFDHPPLVALLIRLSTFNLTITSDFFIRLGPAKYTEFFYGLVLVFIFYFTTENSFPILIYTYL